MNIDQLLKQSIRQAFVQLFDVQLTESDIALQPTRKDFEGSHTFVTFPYGKSLRKLPPEIARLVGEYLKQHEPAVRGFNVVQGFLNLVVADSVWLELFRNLLTDPAFGTFPANQQTVMVEYSSPNTNKPLHLGHLRNNFLGYSVARILKANGYRVVKSNLINDRGIHICKSMLAYQLWGYGKTPGSDGIKGDHLVGKYYVMFETERREQMKLVSGKALSEFNIYSNKTPLDEISKEKVIQILVQSLCDSDIKDKESRQNLYNRRSDYTEYCQSVLSNKFDSLAKEGGLSENLFGKLLEEEATKLVPLMYDAQAMLLKWEQGDEETVNLWKKMNGWVYEGFAQTYRDIGVDFDKTYYESTTYKLGKDIVEEGLQKGVFFRKPDGSVWIDLTADGLDEKLVLRADGTSVYMTQDLGTAELKYQDFHLDKSVHVVGNEQEYHFEVLFAILRRLGRPYADGLYHLSYGMVDLPSGKMKSREGTVVDADELIQEMIETAEARTKELGKIEEFDSEEARQLYKMVGVGALKYFLLKVDPKKRMLFNPEESIDFQGHTGSFIQFNYARISSVLRKARQMGIILTPDALRSVEQVHPTERELIFILSEYPSKVAEAGRTFMPSMIAQHVYDVAKAYGRVWTEVSILGDTNEDTRHFRVALSHLTAQTIRQGMELLGIQVPERM